MATGLPVLDHLVGELARSGRFDVTLEVAPGARRRGGRGGRTRARRSARELARRRGQRPRLGARCPPTRRSPQRRSSVSDRPLLVSNVDFSDQRVGGVSTDVASRFLRELADAAGLNLHVRLVEGTDPQHVLAAIFKAVGAALGQACRPEPWTDKEAT